MLKEYLGVITRFLRHDERLILSNENEMPLVIEASGKTDLIFLEQFLSHHSEQLIQDLSEYGAILLRGFDIRSDADFEKSVLSIKGFQGISDAFMSEEGRIHVGQSKFVLHTNAVYKTGGTLYLGGFHTENYYIPDVPGYICFFCQKPSELGGETGLVNTEKLYESLGEDLKKKLEKHPFFVTKWLVSDVIDRYKLSVEQIEKICKKFDLPMIGHGKDQFILMYKPPVFEHPITKKRSLQINLFELTTLNPEMRACFMSDYQGKDWFWHRFVWRLPVNVLKIIERIYIMFASFVYSPKAALKIFLSKIKTHQSAKNIQDNPAYPLEKVGECFNEKEIKSLAKSIRQFYASFLWQSGDILLIDNKKVMHAGMPGAGPRTIRAMICNPIEMGYSFSQPGCIETQYRASETIGFYMNSGQLDTDQ